MKKLFIFATMLAIAVSCTTYEFETERVQAPAIYAYTESNGSPTKTSISVDAEGVGTIWWKPAEKINVFFGTTSVPYTSTNTEDATTVVFETTTMIGSTEGSSSNKWGLYPYDANATCNGSSVTTTIPDAQFCVSETFDTNLFPMVAQTSDNELHFLNVCGGIKFSLSRSDIRSITFKGNNDENIAGKVKLTLNENDKPVSTIIEGQKTITLTPKTGTTFASGTYYYIVLLPTVFSNGFTMTFVAETEIGTFEYTAKSIEIKRSVFSKKTNIDTYAEFENAIEFSFVDLGLTSGTEWATCNLGANSPNEYGYYYAWGEIEPQPDCAYSWDSYKWANGNKDTITKYVTTPSSGYGDLKTKLELSDDAAYVYSRGMCIIPNREQFQELIDECKRTWTSQNGVNGYLFTGPNGNSLFLPASGLYSGNQLNYCGESGNYLTDEQLGTSQSYCHILRFSSDSAPFIFRQIRSCGLSIRPIKDKNVRMKKILLPYYTLSIQQYEKTTVTVSVYPENAVEDKLNYYSADENVALINDDGILCAISSGTTLITIESASDSRISSAFKVSVTPAPIDRDCVDLGLSVKWATCNIGATRPEEYGDYFAWGEITPKIAYYYPNGGRSDTSCWVYYKWAQNFKRNDGSYYFQGFTKYTSSVDMSRMYDRRSQLEPRDDAAKMNWGGGWRIPTKAEMSELVNSCKWTWTQVNGIQGYEVSKNGKSIFLPCAGYCYSSNIPVGTDMGSYWTSSLNYPNYPECAWGLNFDSREIYGPNRYSDVRLTGSTVRPVKD